MATANPYAHLRFDDLINEVRRQQFRGDEATGLGSTLERMGMYDSSLIGQIAQPVYTRNGEILDPTAASRFWGEDGGNFGFRVKDTTDSGYGYYLSRAEDGSTNAVRQRSDNGIPMEMLAVLAAPLMATYAPSLFGGEVAAGAVGAGEAAAAGSLAEAMATYAPGWWEGITAAGMGGAEIALPTAASFSGAASGLPETSLADVMSQTNPTWGSDVASAGMGDPGLAPGLTSSGGAGLSTGNPILDRLGQRLITNGLTSALTGGGSSGGSSVRPTGTSGSGTGSNNGGGWNMPDATGGLLSGLLQNYVMNNNGDRITDVTNTSADTINALATNLAGQGTFTPYNITSGVGSTTTDANGNMTSQLSDAWRNIQGAAQAQIPSLLTPYSNQNVTNFSNAAYGQANDWINRTANPLYAQNETAGLTGANRLLGVAGGFDPEAAARAEYDSYQALLAPTREQDNLNMESRLLNQGRLGLSYGSTGAAPELAALAQAQRMQDLDAARTSRATAFDRQNQILNQANTMNQMGIQSGAAGLNQQKGIYDIANGLFSSGMAGDNFMENMNVSRTSRARSLQDMALQPEQFLQNQQSQAITAGGARSTAAQNAARLQADLGLQAERIRSGGAMTEAALKNARDAAILQSVTGNGGAGGLLGGVGGAVSGALSGLLSQAANSGGTALQSLVGQLLNSGVQPGDLQGIMEQAGVNIDQYLTYGDELNMDSLLEWANAGDFGDTSSSVLSDIADWMEW